MGEGLGPLKRAPEQPLVQEAFDCGARGVLQLLADMLEHGGYEELHRTIERQARRIRAIRGFGEASAVAAAGAAALKARGQRSVPNGTQVLFRTPLDRRGQVAGFSPFTEDTPGRAPRSGGSWPRT